MLIINRRKLLAGSASLLAIQRARAQNCVNFYPTAPAPAQALGYNTLYDGDDFDIPNSIAPDGSATTFYSWFPSSVASSSNYSVNTTGTAASVSNGNTNAGLFSSTVGGILTITGPTASGNNIMLSSTPPSTLGLINPGFGCWGPNIYVEVYCQFNPSCPGDQGGNQWYAPLSLQSQVSPGLTNPQKIGVVNSYCGNQGFSASTNRFTFNDGTAEGGAWGTGIGSAWKAFVQDSGWHAFGFSWVAKSATTGVIQPFIDNQAAVLQGYTEASAINVGVGGTAGLTSLVTGAPLCIQIGGPPGTGDSVNVDYYRVWGA